MANVVLAYELFCYEQEILL